MIYNFEELMEHENECIYLDFKKEEYRKERYTDLIKDVVAMANANYLGEKYIVVGVKHKPGEGKEFIGVENLTDDSIYQSLIHENVEPMINIEYNKCVFDSKNFGLIKISECNNKPYLMKKDNGSLKKGTGWIRIGSYTRMLIRNDYENIFMEIQDREKKSVEMIDRKIRLLKTELQLLNTCDAAQIIYVQVDNLFQRKIKGLRNNFEEYENNYEDKEFQDNFKKYIKELSGVMIADFDKRQYTDYIKDCNAEMSQKYVSDILLIEQRFSVLKKSLFKISEIENFFFEQLWNNADGVDYEKIRDLIDMIPITTPFTNLLIEKFLFGDKLNERRKVIIDEIEKLESSF